MIERINTATPKLRKGSLLIPGINADLVKADDKAISAQFDNGKTESHDWPDLTARSVERLLHLTVDSDSADDHLAAGIFLLSVGGASVPRDSAAAEAFFDKAKALGAAIDRYLDPLAAAAFASAKTLIEEARGAETPRPQQGEKFAAAEHALAAIEKKYEKAPWLAAHKDDIASALAAAKSGVAESEAERLYAEASKLFEKKELFDLKPLIEKLKTSYPKTRPVTDAARKPTFAEMLKATETLGKFITVRQDGKGDFTSIQAAIDAAPANSLVEIQDSRTYSEKIEIPKEMSGLALRGRSGCWPVVTSAGCRSPFPVLVRLAAPRVTLDRLVLAHVNAAGQGPSCVRAESGPFHVRRCVVIGRNGVYAFSMGAPGEIDGSLVAGAHPTLERRLSSRDSIWLVGLYGLSPGSRIENAVICDPFPFPQCELWRCTIVGPAKLKDQGTHVLDCIVLGEVESPNAGNRIEHCDILGKPAFVDLARPGKGCFSADPQFRDPDNFDYRLKPTSPCRKKASDGGDIGCRYTPEMIEVLEKALELRKKGIIKF